MNHFFPCLEVYDRLREKGRTFPGIAAAFVFPPSIAKLADAVILKMQQDKTNLVLYYG